MPHKKVLKPTPLVPPAKKSQKPPPSTNLLLQQPSTPAKPNNHKPQCHMVRNEYSCGHSRLVEKPPIIHVSSCNLQSGNKKQQNRCTNMASTPKTNHFVRLCDECCSSKGANQNGSAGKEVEAKKIDPLNQAQGCSSSRERKMAEDICVDKLTSELSCLTIGGDVTSSLTPDIISTAQGMMPPPSSILRQTQKVWKAVTSEHERNSKETNSKSSFTAEIKGLDIGEDEEGRARGEEGRISHQLTAAPEPARTKLCSRGVGLVEQTPEGDINPNTCHPHRSASRSRQSSFSSTDSWLTVYSHPQSQPQPEWELVDETVRHEMVQDGSMQGEVEGSRVSIPPTYGGRVREGSRGWFRFLTR